MVFVEGLIDKGKLDEMKKLGYDIIHIYNSVEEAKQNEPDKFDDDSSIGENNLVWAKVFIDFDFEDIINNLDFSEIRSDADE